MNSLLDWMSTIGTFLADWARESFRQLVVIVTSFWGLILVLIGLLWTVLSHLVPALTLILRSLDDIVSGTWDLSAPSGAESVLAICNTFFPLDLMCQLAVSYCLLRVSLATYRIIKSWIPADGTT